MMKSAVVQNKIGTPPEMHVILHTPLRRGSSQPWTHLLMAELSPKLHGSQGLNAAECLGCSKRGHWMFRVRV